MLLEAASDRADVSALVDRMLSTQGGVRVLIDTAVSVIRMLGHDHGEEIAEELDRMRRLAEGEV